MSTSIKRQIRMDLDADLHRRLRIATAQMEMTARAAIRQAIREWLDRIAADLVKRNEAA